MPSSGMWLHLPLCLLAAYLAACVWVTGGAARPVASAHENSTLADAVRQLLLAERESELADLEVGDGRVRLSGRTYPLAMADSGGADWAHDTGGHPCAQ